MIPKFRAYSTEENKMYYPHNDKNVDWIIDNETGFIAPSVNLGDGMWGMIDKYKLMQSTGLKDKNGVEIFEGDVVFHGEGEYSYTGIVRKDRYYFYIEGVNINDSFSFDDVSDTYTGEANLVVIGNIYENPELLEAE